MEIEELVDKYRTSKSQTRYGLLALVGIVPALYFWMNSGEALDARKVAVEAELVTEKDNHDSALQKVAELPVLESKVSEIEAELLKAKEFLPDRIEMESTLGFLGQLEKDTDVKLVKFTPGAERAAPDGLEYKEIPVSIEMRGTFANTMRFMDRIVHMKNLVHIRNINFVKEESKVKVVQDSAGNSNEVSDALIVASNAKLILFKGM